MVYNPSVCPLTAARTHSDRPSIRRSASRRRLSHTVWVSWSQVDSRASWRYEVHCQGPIGEPDAGWEEAKVGSDEVPSRRCHQYLPSSSVPSATGVRTIHSGCINNSVCVTPSPNSPDTPRLLVSSNDELIKVYEVEGRVPDYKAAKRRRERERKAGWSVVEATWAAERGELEYGLSGEELEDEDNAVEEQLSYNEGSACRIVPLPGDDLRLPTAVNHCSVSRDGKYMVAVGDTADVFLYDCRGGRYELAQTFKASDDASFSTDWSDDGLTFAVASQGPSMQPIRARSKLTSVFAQTASSTSTTSATSPLRPALLRRPCAARQRVRANLRSSKRRNLDRLVRRGRSSSVRAGSGLTEVCWLSPR